MMKVAYAGAERDTTNYKFENRAAPTHSGWNAEREATLRRLFAEGQSTSRIAKALGEGCTRNTVIGKVHRLGLKREHVQATFRDTPPGRPADTSKAEFTQRRKSKRAATPSPAPFPGVHVNGSGIHASDCRAGEGRASGTTTRRSGEVGTAAASLVRPLDAALNPSRLLTIADLRDSSCRWPLGDPSELDTFRYCGAEQTVRHRPTAAGYGSSASPYCQAHHRLAYNAGAV